MNYTISTMSIIFLSVLFQWPLGLSNRVSGFPKLGKRECKEEEYLKILSKSKILESDDIMIKNKERTSTKTLVLHEVWRTIVGKNLGLGAKLPSLKSQLYHLQAVSPWERLTSIGFNFFTSKMRDNNSTYPMHLLQRIKSMMHLE